MDKTLIVIAGPTASGKTDAAIDVAGGLDTEIVSADSRQVFREMRIGTAVPGEEQLRAVRHHLIRHRSIHESYDVTQYGTEALAVIRDIHRRKDTAVLCGGSGMYIDAVCSGFDVMPPADPDVRQELVKGLDEHGISWLQEKLKHEDPAYYARVDTHNPVRLIRALEVIRLSGRPYSEQRTGNSVTRPFRMLKYYLDRPREELRERIDVRTDAMMREGLVEEARGLYPYRALNALRTVGYRELFDHFDGKTSLQEASAAIRTNTRRYAKRQETWFARDKAFRVIPGAEIGELLSIVRKDLAGDQ